MSCPDVWDINKFLEQFPQFTDLNEFPQETITFWDDFSTKFLNQMKWGKFYVQGRSLLLAHNLTLANLHGHVSGLNTSKSVDSVSASYDVGNIVGKDYKLYNRTIYGIQFMQLSKIIGAGVIGVI